VLDNPGVADGFDIRTIERSTMDVLLAQCDAASAIVSVDYADFKLMPANQDLVAAEVELMGKSGCETRLRDALAPILDQFDMVLIDCPPALNMLTVNALVAAEGVIIPMQCEYYALEGLTALVNTVEEIKAGPNPQLEIGGILRTMFDPRNNLANEVSAQLIEHFRDRVFRTIIPRNVRWAEAPSYGKPALHYDRESRGALAYLALAGEMIRRDEGDYNMSPAADAVGT
jgi:chromosome partitioning protein